MKGREGKDGASGARRGNNESRTYGTVSKVGVSAANGQTNPKCLFAQEVGVTGPSPEPACHKATLGICGCPLNPSPNPVISRQDARTFERLERVLLIVCGELACKVHQDKNRENDIGGNQGRMWLMDSKVSGYAQNDEQDVLEYGYRSEVSTAPQMLG